jgi:hypothetical protein
MNPQLRDAIENLYDVFSRYPLGAVEGCPCCVTDDDQSQIHARPLRELDGDTLSHFIGSAVLTWGDVDDFKHFLPRILELLAIDDYPLNEELFYFKLDNAGYDSWPGIERDAVIRFWRAWWTHLVSTEALRLFDPIGILACVSHFEEDVDPYLTAWIDCEHPLAGQYLAHSIIWDLDGRSDMTPSGRTALDAWLCSPQVRARLERAFFDEPDGERAQEISDAILIVESMAGVGAGRDVGT